MEKFIDLLSKEVADAFEKAGYDANLGTVNVSNRPDLAEYQCNGAMAAAKVYHKAPIMVANDVVEVFGEVFNGDSLWIMLAVTVGIGEIIACGVLGMLLYQTIKKNPRITDLVD